jgi:hypothetical protein
MCPQTHVNETEELAPAKAVAPSQTPHDAQPQRYSSRGTALFAQLWFAWMVGLWAVFFTLVFADRLEAVWNAIRQLPTVVEVIAWIALLPWMLGMAVWSSGWVGWLRVLLVLCFAVGWTAASVPRAAKGTGYSRS